MKRKPCGREIRNPNSVGVHRVCDYERAPGLQQCRWHWLLKQPADVQKQYADKRRPDPDSVPFIARVPKDQWPAGERWCAGCQWMIPLFYAQGSRCRSCNSEAAHGARVEKVYGITPAEYAALFELQDGRCYICRRKTKKRLAVDHDHASGQVRGLLCADNDRGCNHAILGNIRDLAMAKRIVEYLEDPPYGRLGVENVPEEPQNDPQEAPVGNPWGLPPF